MPYCGCSTRWPQRFNSIIHNLEDGVTIIISKHCEPIVDVASSPTLHQRHRQHIVALFQKSLVP